MRILDCYIGMQVIGSIIMVVVVLLGIESFMEFVSQLSDIGVGHYGILKAFIYVPLQLPTDLYALFPMAGFLGSLIGLGRLASTSQLIVMRSSGVSIVQIATAVIKAAVLLIVVVTFIGEWIAPHWQVKAEHLKKVAMGKYKNNAVLMEGVWLRQDHSYINVATITPEMNIENITRFDFDDANHLTRMAYAAYGKKVDGVWQLFNIKSTLFHSDKVTTKVVSTEPLNFDFQPQLLRETREIVDQESVWGLFHNILYRKKTGLLTSQYQYAFWKRIIQPITTIVMICLGIPFIFGSLRSASMGFRVMTGVIIGFGFYMLNQFFGPITLVYQFPPLLAATLPTILFLMAYVILLKRIH